VAVDEKMKTKIDFFPISKLKPKKVQAYYKTYKFLLLKVHKSWID